MIFNMDQRYFNVAYHPAKPSSQMDNERGGFLKVVTPQPCASNDAKDRR
jgi:hypothetical protein